MFGGTTAISAGGTWIPCNHLAAKGRVADSREEAIRYFRHCAGERLNEPLMNAFLDNGPAMLERFRGTRVATVICGGNLTEAQVREWIMQ